LSIFSTPIYGKPRLIFCCCSTYCRATFSQ
jgi:hypothetical protein